VSGAAAEREEVLDERGHVVGGHDFRGVDAAEGVFVQLFSENLILFFFKSFIDTFCRVSYFNFFYNLKETRKMCQ